MKRRAKKITSLPLKFRNKLVLPDRPTHPIIVRNMKTDGAIWTNDPTAAEVSRAQKSISTLKNMGFNLSADATREIFQRMTGRTSAPGYIMPDEQRRMQRFAEALGLTLNQRKNDGEAVTVNKRVDQPVVVTASTAPGSAATTSQTQQSQITHMVVTPPTGPGKDNGPDRDTGRRTEAAMGSSGQGNQLLNATLQGQPGAAAAHMNKIAETASGNPDVAAANNLMVKPPEPVNFYGSVGTMAQYHGLPENIVFQLRAALEADDENYDQLKEQVINRYKDIHRGEVPSQAVIDEILGNAQPLTTEKTGTIGVDQPISRNQHAHKQANEALAKQMSGYVTDTEARRLITDTSESESDIVMPSAHSRGRANSVSAPQSKQRSKSKHPTAPPQPPPSPKPTTKPPPSSKPTTKSQPPPSSKPTTKTKPATKTQGRPRSKTKPSAEPLPRSLRYPEPRPNSQSKQQPKRSPQDSHWARR